MSTPARHTPSQHTPVKSIFFVSMVEIRRSGVVTTQSTFTPLSITLAMVVYSSLRRDARTFVSTRFFRPVPALRRVM